jgi:hypothetical protein
VSPGQRGFWPRARRYSLWRQGASSSPRAKILPPRAGSHPGFWNLESGIWNAVKPRCVTRGHLHRRARRLSAAGSVSPWLLEFGIWNLECGEAALCHQGPSSSRRAKILTSRRTATRHGWPGQAPALQYHFGCGHGPRCVTRGHLVRAAKILPPRAGSHPGFWNLESGIWNAVKPRCVTRGHLHRGARRFSRRGLGLSLASGIWNLECGEAALCQQGPSSSPRAEILAPRAGSHPGFWNLESGIWNAVKPRCVSRGHLHRRARRF